MALDDVKRMETSIVNFAREIENWLEKRSDEDDTPKTEHYTLEENTNVRENLFQQRLERFADTQAEVRAFIKHILKHWPSSRRFAKEPPLTFLRLVYLEFERIQNFTSNDSESLEQKLFFILDILQDSIFDFEIAKFDTSLKDLDYYLEDQDKLIKNAYIHAQVSYQTPRFSPFPENRLLPIQKEMNALMQPLDLPFSIDTLVLSPNKDLVIRIKSSVIYCGETIAEISPALSFAKHINQTLLTHILNLAMKAYPEHIQTFLNTAQVNIRPYERPDFPHLSQDGKYFYRWYSFVF